MAAAKARAVIVVEGYIDALAMRQAGLANTVALMGTAISDYQIALFKRLAPTAVLMLDGDEGGAQALLRAGELARPAGLDLLVATLPVGSDPAEVLQRDGAEAVRERLGTASAFARFRVRHQVQRADLSSAEGKDRLVGELRAVFADIPSSVVREDLLGRVAERLTLPVALVSSWMPTTENSAEARHCSPTAATLQRPRAAHVSAVCWRDA
jgi:DNA primase